jgi:cation diffusion facilitator family transporter
MDACCESKIPELESLRSEHKRTLLFVLAINVVLFFVEVVAGVMAHSTALLADSLDMLGDSLVYAFSLYVLWQSADWKAMAAILKGAIMAVFGVGVLIEAVYKMMADVVPNAETMGIIGLLVLLGNGVCFLMLFRHRSDDLNMRSTWLCSLNDIIANLSVLASAGGVAYFRSIWPDVLVGGIIALLFLRTALSVLSESVHEYRAVKLNPERTS